MEKSFILFIIVSFFDHLFNYSEQNLKSVKFALVKKDNKFADTIVFRSSKF